MGMSASQARLLSITARLNDVEYKSQSIANTKIRLADESERLAQDYAKSLNRQKYTYTTYQTGQAQKVDLTLGNLMQVGSKYRLVSSDGKVVLNSYEKGLLNGPPFCDFVNDTNRYGENGAENYYSGYMATKKSTFQDSDIQDFISQGLTTQEAIDYHKNVFNMLVNNATKDSEGNVTKFNYVVLPDASASNPSLLYDMIESGEFMLVDISTGENVTASNTVALSIETDKTEFAKAEAEYNAANMKINNKEKVLDNEMKKLDTEHNALQTEFDAIKNLIGNNIDKSFNLFS